MPKKKYKWCKGGPSSSVHDIRMSSKEREGPRRKFRCPACNKLLQLQIIEHSWEGDDESYFRLPAHKTYKKSCQIEGDDKPTYPAFQIPIDRVLQCGANSPVRKYQESPFPMGMNRKEYD